MDIRERIEQLARRMEELAKELEELKKEAAGTETVKTVEYTKPILPPKQQKVVQQPRQKRQASKSSFEEFVGKNIASRVGILVTIVGIFFGVRYAIEHELVSPFVRVISGYSSGLALIGFAIFLKKKYEGYSSVLMGGGLAVMYFITYTAYAYYSLLPQTAAFIMMLVFTAATVYAALIYNQVFIAHIGLIGAYAIPFLLSDNSGRYLVLFSYIAIINVGILVISFRKYWKSLFYTSYILTWLIYAAWHMSAFDDQFTLAFVFRSIFFISFYATFLAYKLVKKEKFGAETITILLSNAFIFYAFGYDALAQHDKGLFTVINAVIHFGVSQLIRPRLADKALYYLVFGLTIIFITIAIPVQFDGNWVTLLWIGEAVLMFYIGRIQRVPVYEKLSLSLLLLSAFSLAMDWTLYVEDFERIDSTIAPFANITFVTGLLVVAAVGSILYLIRNKKYTSALPEGNLFRNYFPHIVTIIFLLVAYFVFYLEILAYFSHTEQLLTVLLILYSMVFTSIVVWINQRWIKNAEMNIASLVAIGLLALIVLTVGFRTMNELNAGIAIRYIVMAVMALLLLQGRDATKSFSEKSWTPRGWQLLIHTMILAMLSAEYLNWTTIYGDGNQYKLGLSILWGVYALYLIVWGIFKKQKHLRLAAIALFIITLLKLFVYDLDEAGTVTKTISFISLGVILLLVSYLYNRYKEVLFGSDEK